MLEFIRSKNKLLFFVLLILIVPSFVFFGVQGYSGFMDGSNAAVAEVDGRSITRNEWEMAHQRQIEQVRQRMPGVDARLFDAPEMRRETLDQLVRERVMFAAINDKHFAVSDARLVRALKSMPELASVRNDKGELDREAYKAFLQARGLTTQNFEASISQDLMLRQVTQPLAESALGAAGPARTGLQALLEKRTAQVQRFETSAYLSKVKPTDEEIQAYYDKNQERYRAPERATIEYVVLDLDAIKKGISVPEQKLREFYEQNISRYTSAEERRASHILVKADKDAPAAEREKAKQKAESVLAEVRQKPAAFAELAKKHSDDPGSAERGGDLDFFGRGAMVKPFEDAVFAMKQGEISNVVESDFGYHIIRLDAVRGGDQKPFDAVREEIANEAKGMQAQREFAESAEQFTNMVYEQSDSLEPVIERLKLEKKTATVDRNPAPGATGALASQKLLDQVFGTDAVQNKRNTDAVEVGPSQLAAARVVKHEPARTLPLEEVKDQVRQQVAREQAAALARKEGEALLAKLKGGGEAPSLPAPVTLSRSQAQGQPRAVIDAVLGADATKLPAPVGVSLGDEGYVVARVTKVEAPTLEGEEFKQLQDAYARTWAAAEQRAYYDALKRRYKVEVKPQMLESTDTQR